MPARNVTKLYQEDAYYHVYNRGVEKRVIFKDDQDYKMFLYFLKRHLSRHAEPNSRNQVYETYAGRVELLAYCLMPNHFHLLFYLNNDTKAISELMRKVAGTYTAYFNRRHNRVGYLFQGTYKASEVDNDAYLLHISRYIHRNPEDYYNWPYSSLQYYIGDWKSDWVVPDRIYKLYEWGTYEAFLNEYNPTPELEDQLFS
jgi:REP element-mobilizing transposase RayT